MALPASRPRDLAHRAGLQPARRRPARRVRPALLALTTAVFAAACGDGPRNAPPREDFLRRFLENDWEGVGDFAGRDLAADLRRYIRDGDRPVYPPEGPRVRALARFVAERKPDPAALVAVFDHGDDPPEVTEELLRRDAVGTGVAEGLARRAYRARESGERAACWDALARLAAAFAFDRAWGDAHTNTGVVVTDFFASAEVRPCPESDAALRAHLGAILGEWRQRVTDKGSSTFFGIVMRHMGSDGTAMLLAEWPRMNADEREDLLRRVAYEDEASPAVRRGVVAALLDDSFDVRDAAHQALRAHGAPLRELDASARDAEVEKALPRLRKWAGETQS